MKRILIAVAILTLLCTVLTACAGNKPEGNNTGTGTTPSTTVTGQPTETPTQGSGETPTQPATEAPTEPVTDPDGGLWSPEIR